MQLIHILLGLLIFSCATENTPVISRKESTPFLRRYKKKNKELIYIAISDKGSVDEPTMKLIKDTVKKLDPEIIVTKFPIEGDYRLETDLSQCEQNLGCTPSAWTCLMAKPRGIPCLTGEPYHSSILKKIPQ